jgi:hypothetical protein
VTTMQTVCNPARAKLIHIPCDSGRSSPSIDHCGQFARSVLQPPIPAPASQGTTQRCRTPNFNVSVSMAARNKYVAKSKRGPGRPRKPDAINQTIPVALSKDLVAKLDAWCKREGVKFRSAAIRRFVENALRERKPRR